MDSSRVWRKCSTCKKDILLGQPYQICSVSTCQARKTNYAFCSVICWDGHLPIERHRGDSASAIEKRAPREAEPLASADSPAPKRSIVGAESSASKLDDDEILVVVSKTKQYIAEKSGFNTSAGVFKILTGKLKRICDQAIEEARRSGRKTVLDRDIS